MRWLRGVQVDGRHLGADRIFLDSTLRDNGLEKDPTVQAVGMGTRFTATGPTIIVDDAVVLSNTNDYEADPLADRVSSRLPAVGGRLVVIGTRVAPIDLCSGCSTRIGTSLVRALDVLRQPRSLGVRGGQGLGDALAKSQRSIHRGHFLRMIRVSTRAGTGSAWRVRNQVPGSQWALVYQQQGVDESVFNATCVMGSVERRRKAGPLKAGAWGHPRNGQGECKSSCRSTPPVPAGLRDDLRGGPNHEEALRLELLGRPELAPSWYADLLEASAPVYRITTLVIEAERLRVMAHP